MKRRGKSDLVELNLINFMQGKNHKMETLLYGEQVPETKTPKTIPKVRIVAQRPPAKPKLSFFAEPL